MSLKTCLVELADHRIASGHREEGGAGEEGGTGGAQGSGEKAGSVPQQKVTINRMMAV